MSWVDLSTYENSSFQPGRGIAIRWLWYLVSLLLFESGWFPLSRPKAWLLRAFGASIGRGLVLKPHVRIKFPWRLRVGDYCWIGQGVWIDNLATVEFGSHVCVSQMAYLCTGSHDYRQRGFNLITNPIRVETGAWVGAGCILLGNVTVGANAIVAAGAVVSRNVPPATIVAGNPARPLPTPRTPPESSTEATDGLPGHHESLAFEEPRLPSERYEP